MPTQPRRGSSSKLELVASLRAVPRGLILLDRDGVLNRVVVDPEHGTIDSPLHPSQVETWVEVPGALKRLCDAGYTLAIVSNQPAAAKGKTTRANLEAVHARVLELVCAQGATIASSHVCFHRSEDGCACRKPNPGLLEEACREHAQAAASGVWMVGDGVTDIEAGQRIGARTAYLGPRKSDAYKIFEGRELNPDFWGSDLEEFVDDLNP